MNVGKNIGTGIIVLLPSVNQFCHEAASFTHFQS